MFLVFSLYLLLKNRNSMSSQFVRYEEGRRDDVENAGQEEDSRGQSPKLNRLLPKKDGLGEQRRDDVILWC
jgi:hypothetical protein